MTENSLSLRKTRLLKCIVMASDYRKATGFSGGYVKVHDGKIVGVCDEIPEIKPSKWPGNPTLVDEDDNVFIAEYGKFRLKRIEYTGDKKAAIKKKERSVLAEHIADILRIEMINLYKGAEDQINEWFNSCTVPLSDNQWRRLEFVKICHAYNAMIHGRPLESLIIKKAE